jgi:hypothetical protein
MLIAIYIYIRRDIHVGEWCFLTIALLAVAERCFGLNL